MLPIYISLGIWSGTGIGCWVFIMWYSITKDYRLENFKRELKGIMIWECLIFCILFGPLTWILTLPTNEDL